MTDGGGGGDHEQSVNSQASSWPQHGAAGRYMASQPANEQEKATSECLQALQLLSSKSRAKAEI